MRVKGKELLMSTHRFKIGQRVRLSASASDRAAAGIYKVVSLLPESRGEWQYRLQSAASAQQRVAWESQLAGVEPL
jgi:hypothetical protein